MYVVVEQAEENYVRASKIRRTRGMTIIFPALSLHTHLVSFPLLVAQHFHCVRCTHPSPCLPKRKAHRHWAPKTTGIKKSDHKPPISQSKHNGRAFHSLTGHNMRAHKSKENTVRCVQTSVRMIAAYRRSQSQNLVHWILSKAVIRNDSPHFIWATLSISIYTIYKYIEHSVPLKNKLNMMRSNEIDTNFPHARIDCILGMTSNLVQTKHWKFQCQLQVQSYFRLMNFVSSIMTVRVGDLFRRQTRNRLFFINGRYSRRHTLARLA